jgi:toxin ParE1/3/4
VIFRVVFTRPALHDLDEIGDYLRALAGPLVADRLIEDAIAAAESLRTMPTRRRERTKLGWGLRSIPVRNHLIFYRVDDGVVSILRVLHGSRDITSKLFPPSPGEG